MPENNPSSPSENPHERFRRLLDEAEKAEQEAENAPDLRDFTT